jgi:hypothetical protein
MQAQLTLTEAQILARNLQRRTRKEHVVIHTDRYEVKPKVAVINMGLKSLIVS